MAGRKNDISVVEGAGRVRVTIRDSEVTLLRHLGEERDSCVLPISIRIRLKNACHVLRVRGLNLKSRWARV